MPSPSQATSDKGSVVTYFCQLARIMISTIVCRSTAVSQGSNASAVFPSTALSQISPVNQLALWMNPKGKVVPLGASPENQNARDLCTAATSTASAIGAVRGLQRLPRRDGHRELAPEVDLRLPGPRPGAVGVVDVGPGPARRKRLREPVRPGDVALVVLGGVARQHQGEQSGLDRVEIGIAHGIAHGIAARGRRAGGWQRGSCQRRDRREHADRRRHPR